ncbi:MAG: 50S ribosomal protein L25 [Candidatus Liptonbacteria bacterium]|nr:50S ribosomal protein L25 [Candidatus Liptonbacteria bacterium]
MELAVQKRDPKTKPAAGQIWAVLYGKGVPSQNLLMPERDFDQVFRAAGKSTVVQLVIDSTKHPVMIHDVQRDRLSGAVTHVDFYQVGAHQKIQVPVPIVFTGESPAVKAVGGILNRAMNEIEVEALPDHLPHEVHLDLGLLAEIGSTLYVRDIPVPANVQVISSPDSAVVSITAPRAEEEVVAPATVDVSAVKVEGEEKKAEREAKKTSTESSE